MDLNENQPPESEAPSKATPPVEKQETTPSAQETPSSSSGTGAKKTNIMAILGLVFGILIAPVGLILSIVALGQIKKDSNLKGEGLAKAGLIIGAVLTLFFIIMMIVGLLS